MVVIYKEKTVPRKPKVAEGVGTSRNAGTSKFKLYSEKKKVNEGIGDNAEAKILRTSLVLNKGSVMTGTKTKVGKSGAPVARSSNDSLDKARVRRKALADVSNIRGQASSRYEKPSGPRNSMTYGTHTTTTSSNRSLPGNIKANINGGVRTVNTSTRASSSQALRTSSNFRRVQVNKTMENTTRKSFPVMKKASQLDSGEIKGDMRSLEKSARKTGIPVKTRAGGKLIPQMSTLKGKILKEKVNDGFIVKGLRNQTDKDAVGGVRKLVKPIVRTSLQIPDYRKNLKSKSICSLPKSLVTTSARRVKVATSFVAKPSKPIGSCEEVTGESISAEGSDSMKSLNTEASEITATKKSGRRKSYTSSLISRSKLLEMKNEVRECEQLPNIDDEGNPLEVAEYVDDIYEYYWIMEAQSNSLENYMINQTDATPRMRGILINWLVEVHLKFDLMPETLYLSVSLLDRYLSLVTLKKKQFQLVGLVSLLLASKYEDFWHPRVKDLISISAESYTRKQMLDMEKSILKKLKFRLNLPTAYVFMLRFLKASQSDKKLEHLAFYLIELCLVDYDALRFRPSLLCASAVYVARCTLNEVPAWTSLLGKHSRYEEHQIRDCADMILQIHKAASASDLKVTYDKYMQPEFGSAAAVRPLDSLPKLRNQTT